MFGLLAPAEYGGVDVSAACFATVAEELARGWMSLAGAMGGHSVVTYLIRTFGTPAQRERTCRAWPPARSGPRWR